MAGVNRAEVESLRSRKHNKGKGKQEKEEEEEEGTHVVSRHIYEMHPIIFKDCMFPNLSLRFGVGKIMLELKKCFPGAKFTMCCNGDSTLPIPYTAAISFLLKHRDVDGRWLLDNDWEQNNVYVFGKDD
eukprot:3936844-Rhodomonas_salina.1